MNAMLQKLRRLLWLACLVAFSLAMLSPAALGATAPQIWVPRAHNPAFVEPGGSFLSEVVAPSTLSAAGWSAAITNELRSWNCTVVAAIYGRIHHGTEDGWQLTIRVGSDVPPELCALKVAHSTAGAGYSIRSVSVVKQFESNFYILQLTDQHITSEKAVKANGSASLQWGNGSTESMGWAAPVINLINPRFVIFTGDNFQVYNDATSWCGLTEGRKRMRIYLEGLKPYTVPTVLTTGNHDIGYSSYTNSRTWRDTYEQDIGQRNFSFRMGSFYVLNQEFSYDEFLPWAKADYAASWTDSTVKYRLIGIHFNDPWTVVADASRPCNLMIVGHNHSTKTLATTPYPVLSSGASQDYHKASFFSFERNASGWFCRQTTNHVENVTVFRLFGDWGSSPKLSASFAFPNNGTKLSNSVSVVNQLPQDFYHGRVKFLMNKGSYTASGGTIEAQYDYNNGSNTAVLVKADFKKNSTTTISLMQPTIGKIEKLMDGRFWLRVNASPGQYAVETATGLSNWQEQATLNSATNYFDYIDPQTNLPRRFYRIRQRQRRFATARHRARLLSLLDRRGHQT